uniref:Uncharacterized protein n=1 Tax=Xenopus tropicalis TaxID=8364 RepID=A0A803JJE0_XENTR
MVLHILHLFTVYICLGLVFANEAIKSLFSITAFLNTAYNTCKHLRSSLWGNCFSFFLLTSVYEFMDILYDLMIFHGKDGSKGTPSFKLLWFKTLAVKVGWSSLYLIAMLQISKNFYRSPCYGCNKTSRRKCADYKSLPNWLSRSWNNSFYVGTLFTTNIGGKNSCKIFGANGLEASLCDKKIADVRQVYKHYLAVSNTEVI